MDCSGCGNAEPENFLNGYLWKDRSLYVWYDHAKQYIQKNGNKNYI